MNPPTIVYATSNPGKITEIGRLFGFHGLAVHALADFLPGITLDPDENGASLGDNARIKARAYAEALSAAPLMRGRSFVVLSDDTGIFIDGLGGEPDIRVRRWIGRKMTDEEIIKRCLSFMSGLTGPSKEKDRAATFRTVLCMMPVSADGAIGEAVTVEGELRGHILEAADPRRIQGFPFESLFYADEYRMLLGDLHRLPDAAKRSGRFHNHRERAIEKAIPVIKGMVGR